MKPAPVLAALFLLSAVAASAQTYNYTQEAALAAKIDLDHPDPAQLRTIYAARRARVLAAIRAGAMLVFSVEENQPRHLEFQVPQSENHDFQYLTGLDGLDSYDSALLLLPTPKPEAEGTSPAPQEVLYTCADPTQIKAATGIADVRPFSKLEEDLSVSLTDYRDWRITQIRRWPVAAALARTWDPYPKPGETATRGQSARPKPLYLNYPRFPRLAQPEPVRFELFTKLQRYSADLQLRDSAHILDTIRMLHDAYDLACLRRAVQITGEGIVEGFRMAKPGVTETQVMETMDYVYRYRGATLGFPTEVQETPIPASRTLREVPEGYIAFVSRSGENPIFPGGVVHVDTGASYLNHSADIQRTVPVDGHFTADQLKLYKIALDVQKTVIEHIKPGVTWWELHNIAIKMLTEAGYADYYKYGIGHFTGMEVHDEGDYSLPLQPGMTMAIEQGVLPPGGPRMAFEDNVLVTETGHEWLSQSIPIEPADVEKMMAQPSSFRTFATKLPTP